MSGLKDKLREMFSRINAESIKQTLSAVRGDLPATGALWGVMAVCVLFWEMLLKLVTESSFEGTGMCFLLYIPAVSLFMTLFTGWLSERVNRIAVPVIVTLVNIFYLVQLGYYLVFGSLLSVSLLGFGGAAMTDFGWTIRDTIIGSLWKIIFALVPAIEAIILTSIDKLPKRRVNVWTHVASLLAGILLWILATACLGLFGTGKHTPYYLYHSAYASTDATFHKLGAMPTTVREIGAYVFGIQGDSDIAISASDGDQISTGGRITLGGTTSAPGETVTRDEDSSAQGTSTSTSGDGAEGGDDGQTAATTPVVTEPVRRVDSSLDLMTLRAGTENSDIKQLCDYVATREGSYTNEYTGLLKDYNVIYICAESFWTYAIDETVTPTLYKMAHNGIVLNNYYNYFTNTTTNGEFALLTSLWPDTSRSAKQGKATGSMPQSASNYMPFGLGNIFTSLGGTAYGYHNFKGAYYSRSESLPNLGFTCRFMRDKDNYRDIDMKFTTNWPTSDYEMIQQSVGDYINDDHFVAYYMTFSGHGQYNDTNPICERNFERAGELTAGRGYIDQAIGYYACHIELDKAMEYLLAELEKAGKLDNTLIVIAADHYPYYVEDAAYKSLTGKKKDKKFDLYKSTCIMYTAGLAEPIVSDEYCCNVDILPTVLNLLDIDFDSRLIAGTDIFDPLSQHKAVLDNGNFITEYVRYDATENNESKRATWLVDVSDYTQEELDAYIASVEATIDAEYSASLKINDTDFYRYIFGK